VDSLNIKQREWDYQAGATDNILHQVCRRVDEQEFFNLIIDIKEKLFIEIFRYSVLDVGCGNAVILKHLRRSFQEVYGTDFSSSMINKAKELIPEGNFSQGEATKLDFGSESFERVLAYSIFHYFPSVQYGYEVINEMIRVCKKGGVILIGDLLDKDYEDIIKNESDLEYEKKIPHIQRYSEWQFFDLNESKALFESKGYKVDIFDQPEDFKCAHYRKDLRIWV